MIKMEIRSSTIPYSENKARNQRNLQNQLESRLQLLEEKEKAENVLQEYERLETELRLIYERIADGAIFRSKIRWIERGEKPTKYFFNLERRNYINKTIIEVINVEGETISKDEDILEEIRKIYENPYTADSSIGSNESFQVFTENLSTNLLKLSEKKIELEGKLA